MNRDAIIWTEGKTDAQLLMRAQKALNVPSNFDFPVTADMGDDQLHSPAQRYSFLIETIRMS
jgi:hypothetical protein